MKPVDADEITNFIKICMAVTNPYENRYEKGKANAYTLLMDYISDLEPVEPKDGESAHRSRWEYDEEGTGLYCKRCGGPHGGGFSFCSYCGAIMDEEEQNER